MSPASRPRLCLFAKEPVAGRVKTRLARDLGEARAVRLYDAFLTDLARSLPSPREWEAVVATHEETPGPRLRLLFEAGWTFRPQGDGSLGDRLARAFGEAAGAGVAETVVIGSDAPTISARDVRGALEALRGRADAVFSPAPDGGYSLVGLRLGVEARRVFSGVPWSTSGALARTRRNAEAAGYRTELLAAVPDVDLLADLAPLRERLAREPELAPATWSLLAELAP